MSKNKVAVIGSGFAGLSAATCLAKGGKNVHVYEKNDQIGGRARQFSAEGFVFDMGPSWYWMPDVFERYFERFGHNPRDFYELKLLDPSFTMVFGQDDVMNIPANFDDLCALFEETEKGAADKLRKFMKEAAYKYDKGINDLVYKPGLSIFEFADPSIMKDVFRLQLFSNFSKHVRSYFKHPKLIALMEFPVLFLGAMPEQTPALYSLMNYAGLKLGTWYPMGGFHQIIKGMEKVALEAGVQIHTSSPISQLNVSNKNIDSIQLNGNAIDVDTVVASADYNHVEKDLLQKKYRNYSEKYWASRTFAPSSLLFYLGVNKKVPRLEHHTLFFDHGLQQHSEDIYINKQWPEKPLFYVCCPSKTDPSVAPIGQENLFLLMPIAPGLEDGEALREKYFELMMTRLEKYVGEDLRNSIVYKRSYCVSDFIQDYNAYQGNAYGLANTLMQTAILKPSIKSKKVNNLYFSGQLTVPGPGVPPSLISGQVVADQILKQTS
ncbi:MAG: phytoene desaturase [Polaribacter sp.]|jgi:phytoene desaturase